MNLIINTKFEFKLTTKDDILETIKVLKAKTSFGFDGISSNRLKQIANIIASPLSLITNQSLITGIFPDQLKIAKVIPLFKKDDRHIFDNYRPISLLPAISKVIEKIVYKQLYDYFVKNKLIYSSQYGFRKDHSTELASLELCDRILGYLDEGKLPITIFLDLSKAFDTLDHKILLSKLKYYGVNGIALKWFHSYLTNRYQYIQYNDVTSTMLTIETGVPQGSILGPLLFLIYMNDIYLVSDKFSSILYADDTTLDSPITSFDIVTDGCKFNKEALSENINAEIKLITDWLAVNKLSLNAKKTKFMFFHFPQRNITSYIPDLTINNIVIERVTKFNFLGLTLDEHMSWKSHTHKICNKMSRCIGVMNRLKRFLPLNILKLMYNSLILPHVQYSILCWGFNPGKTFTLQKRAIRTITASKYNAHTSPLFKKLQLLKFKDIFEISILKFYHKLKNSKLPAYFNNILDAPPVEHTHDTRHKAASYPNYSISKTGENCIRYALPALLKLTPDFVIDKVSTHSLKGFATYIKNHSISSYIIICEIHNCYICNRDA